MWVFREWIVSVVINSLSEDAIVWARRAVMGIAVGFIVFGLVTGNTTVGMFGFLGVVLIVLPRLYLYRD